MVGYCTDQAHAQYLLGQVAHSTVHLPRVADQNRSAGLARDSGQRSRPYDRATEKPKTYKDCLPDPFLVSLLIPFCPLQPYPLPS